MKRLLLIGVILLAALLPGALPAEATTGRCLPASDIIGGLHPSDCTLPYDDSGKIINAVDVCHNYSYGLEISKPGYDYLMSTRILRITPSGTLSSGGTLSLLSTMHVVCRSWNAYTLTGSLSGPNGVTVPVTFGAGTLSDQSWTLDTDDYCFIKQLKSACRWLDFSGSAVLPAQLPGGSYSLTIHVVSIDTLAGQPTGLPHVDVAMVWRDLLVAQGSSESPAVTPTPSNAPTIPTPNSIDVALPTPEITFYGEGDTAAICYMTEVTPEAIKRYGVTGTHWKISVQPGTLLDEFDLPTGLPGDGTPVVNQTANGASVIKRISDGTVVNSYMLRQQTAGLVYRCDVALNTTSGRSQYRSVDLVPTRSARDFKSLPATTTTTTAKKPVTQTVCVKGKTVKRFSGTRCPSGWKKK